MNIRNSMVLAGAIVLALLLAACSSDSTMATATDVNANNDQSGFAGCLTTNTIDAAAPDWIKNNFICVDVSVTGGTITMTTTDQPPYYDFYYETTHQYYSTAGQPATVSPNTLSAQNVVITFPSSPADSGTSQLNPGAAWITIHGVLIFNNQANPPDILADEIDTMDTNNVGHSTQDGFYHHHTEPLQISNNDSVLIGVARDGFPIFGRQEEDGSIPFTGENVTDNFHSHAVDTADAFGFNGATTTHYHVVDSDFETTSGGVATEVPWMFGPTSQFYAGTAGTISGGP